MLTLQMLQEAHKSLVRNSGRSPNQLFLPVSNFREEELAKSQGATQDERNWCLLGASYKDVVVWSLIDEIVRKSVRDYHSRVERFIRDYLRTHRTTRLDIALVTGEPTYRVGDGGELFCRTNDGKYEVQVHRDVGIRQRLPVSFRPNLP